MSQSPKATPVEPALGQLEDTRVKGVALASFMLKFILVVRTTKINFNTFPLDSSSKLYLNLVLRP